MTIALDLGSYSDIGDYSSLVEKIKLWLDRGSELDAQIPTFISLAEGYLNRTLRTPDMEVLTPVSPSAGTFTLPLDCYAVRFLLPVGDAARLGPLKGTSPALLANSLCGYALIGRQVMVAPASITALNLIYWQRIPSLTLSNPVNWLISSHPDVYLYGALAQAEVYIENPDRAAQWLGLFEGAVEQLNQTGKAARYGGPLEMSAGVQQVACA